MSCYSIEMTMEKYNTTVNFQIPNARCKTMARTVLHGDPTPDMVTVMLAN